MEITLKDDDGNKLVLKRGSDNPSDAAYRERTMTLNGKVVAQGAPSAGDRRDSDIQAGNKRGTESYLIPWNWDAETGEKVASLMRRCITGIHRAAQRHGMFRTAGPD